MTELKNSYDIIIVGAGIAGITAGIYALRAGRKVAIIERMALGGQLNFVGKIENYPGISEIDGLGLVSNLQQQVKKLGLEIIYDEVVDYKLEGLEKNVVCKKATYLAKSIILALGSNPKELEIQGEREFKGQGVSYCVQCDGNFFRGKDVAVVGSNQSAIDGALYLSGLCKKVYLCTQYDISSLNLEVLKKHSNVEIIENILPKEIKGELTPKYFHFEKNGEKKSVEIDGVFVVAGNRPNTQVLSEKIQLTDRGFIVCDENMQTSEEGVFACGDVRDSKLKQVSTAVGDGALAGVNASAYVLKSHS